MTENVLDISIFFLFQHQHKKKCFRFKVFFTVLHKLMRFWGNFLLENVSVFIFFYFDQLFFHRFAQQISFAIILICVCILCLSNPILYINVVFLSSLLPYFYSCKQKTVNLKCFRFAEKKIWRILFRQKTQISFHRL